MSCSSSTDTIPPNLSEREDEFDGEFDDVIPCPTKDERLPPFVPTLVAMSGVDGVAPTRLPQDMSGPQAMCGGYDPTELVVDPTRLTGVVKWFNNKSGFGFITVCQESHPLHAKDVFCYYKSLRVVNYQFRYLIQGEYVDFTLVKAAVEPHEYQAVDVTGVKGGPLMCETRSIKNEADTSPFPPFLAKPKSRYHAGKGNGKGNTTHEGMSQKTHTPSYAYHANPPPPLSQKRVQAAPRKQPLLPDEDGFMRVGRHHHPRQNRGGNGP